MWENLGKIGIQHRAAGWKVVGGVRAGPIFLLFFPILFVYQKKPGFLFSSYFYLILRQLRSD